MNDETSNSEQNEQEPVQRVVTYTCPRCKKRLKYVFWNWSIQSLRRRSTPQFGDKSVGRVRVFIPLHTHSQTGKKCPASHRRHTLTASRGQV
ncbi:MAG: hypothetical protein GYA36_19385 [Veillonellaceae bacterium]|nr:hypothetical protein [Veillonellaceae bacterium]